MGRPRQKELVVFGERLGEALARSRFATKTELLRALDDVPPMTLHRYEVGPNSPPMDLVGRLADLLGVSADFLMGRDTTSEPVNDEGLSLFDEALNMLAKARGVARLEPGVTQHLREFAEKHPYSSTDRLSSLFRDLETQMDVYAAIQAERATKVKEAPATEVTPREGAMKREPKAKGRKA